MRATDFDDSALLPRLRAGEPAAYRQLVRHLHASLVRFAAAIIGSHAQGEEIAQDTWIAVYEGIDRFEGRSSLSTWIYSIATNRARTRISREKRLTGLGSLLDGAAPGERGMPALAFKPDGHWAESPRLWDELDPERTIAGRQLWERVQSVVASLPTGQRAVVVLRDMDGRTAEEACAILEISPENQRVLLHRARSRIREEIDRLTGVAPAPRPARSPRGKPGGTGMARLCHALTRIAPFAAPWPGAASQTR